MSAADRQILIVIVGALVGYGQIAVVGWNYRRSDKALAISCAIGIVIVESALFYVFYFAPSIF